MARQRKIVFLYSGQGSHYYQMGLDLFEQRGAFYRNAIELDDLLRQHLGVSIIEAIHHPYRKISDLFDQTPVTHPAIFLIEYALGKALLDEGIEPDYVLATSMGAFAALAMAGSITVGQAALAVVTQAKLVEAHCPAGGMLALPNVSRQQAETLAGNLGCEMASVNRWTGCVIAADQWRLDAAEMVLRRDRIAFQRLSVSRAFHSRWIDAAEAQYRAFLSSVRVTPPRIPVVCCMGAGVLNGIPEPYLWDVIRKPIRFDETIHNLCSRESLRFIDVGPSGALATSLKYCLPDRGFQHDVQAVLSRFGGGATRYHQTVSSNISAR
jgi:bacillaene synthase trans-acting acyltransferase